MKICILMILFMGTVLGQHSVGDEQKLYRLVGSVNKAKTTYNRPDEVHIGFEINYKLTNISDKNLFLWKPNHNGVTLDNKLLEGIPWTVGRIFSKSHDFSEDSILESYYGGPSTSYADEWEILRRKLNVEQPPKDVTITLQPNESWEFTSAVSIIAFRNKRPGRIDFDTLKKYLPIWVKTYHEVWSSNIEPKGKDRSSKLAFGRMLQKRWIDYGHLLLDDLVSEPIRLDLNSTGIKTEFQP